MTDHQPTTPDLVEVVSADSVDDMMAEMAAQLATLEEELDQLEAQAAALERRVTDATRAQDAEQIAGPLVRQVLDAQMAETRTSMAAALDEAVREADVRIARARAAAAALAANRAPFEKPDARRATDDAAPVTDGSCEAPPHWRDPPAVLPPPHGDRPPVPADDLTTVMPAVDAGDAPPVELTENASTAFGHFWVDDSIQRPDRDGTTGLIDIVLPLVALLIIIVVVLSWIG